MAFKIEKTCGGMVTTLRLIGRLRSEDVEELKRHVDQGGGPLVLDLLEVTLVDLDVVRFLNSCENQGAEIVNGSPYIRKWMLLERKLEL
jgi:anti-anti-sigma regulatory factor